MTYYYVITKWYVQQTNLKFRFLRQRDICRTPREKREAYLTTNVFLDIIRNDKLCFVKKHNIAFLHGLDSIEVRIKHERIAKGTGKGKLFLCASHANMFL